VKLADINLIPTDHWRDLLSGEDLDDTGATLEMPPYQTLWLSNLFDE
jgi:sucrose phosphorylase